MSKRQTLCIICNKDMNIFSNLPCNICQYEIINGQKTKVDKECIHYTQYSTCNKCLYGDGGKIIYLNGKKDI